jgi:hypothetical protein
MIKSAKSDADRIRTHGINNRGPGANATGFGSDAELIRTHGINKPKTAHNDHLGPATGAQRIRAAELDQPAAVTALTDSDLGSVTVAERIRTQRNR